MFKYITQTNCALFKGTNELFEQKNMERQLYELPYQKETDTKEFAKALYNTDKNFQQL